MANVPLRPLGAKFFGVFMTPLPSGNSNSSWLSPYSFENNIKPQIDAVKSIGGNFFPYFGEADVVTLGDTTLAVYLARRRQVAEYIQSVGMYALTYGGSGGRLDKPAHNNTQYTAVLAADAALHSQFANNVGYVTIDEPWSACTDYGGGLSRAATVAMLAEQYAACKAVVPPDFGICTAPMPGGQNGSAVFGYSGADQTRTDLVAPYNDFWAYHPFYSASASELAPVQAAYPGKQFILPSAVLTEEGDSTAVKQARQAAIMALCSASDVRGMANFLCVEYPTGGTWGLFNNNGATPPVLTERSVKTNAFRAGNTAIDLTRHRHITGKPRLTQFHQKGYA